MPEHQAAVPPSTGGVQVSLDALPVSRLEEAVLAITARMDELRAAAAEQRLRADGLERQVAAFEQQLAIAEAKLAVETMHSAGLAAQASHLLAVAVEAGVPALQKLIGGDEAGEVPKGRLAQIYDEAFDAKGADLGIEEPGRFREA
ncbi:hypothetical protein [Roseomonas indoligenes]|uniref:Uncharacterized protein n=1 Tax=Roseomonas indoligenes TaxID=2820811 RepID=A0A940N0A9_9PROT|nr:hypothetical protein [Pararoseomonas indoligenes]MBP0495501.1 hypothetical protein [Pararoseomonas indoligenes]